MKTLNRRVTHSILIITMLSTLVFFTSIDFGDINSTTLPTSSSNCSLQDEMHEFPQSQFYLNLGQIPNSDVLYCGYIHGGTVGFGESKIFLWSKEGNSNLILSFKDAESVNPAGQLGNKHETNFFLGARGTYLGVLSYQEILYKDIWSGIDVRFHITATGLKYEFVVEPYADTKNIVLHAEGPEEIDVKHESVVFRMKNIEFIDEGLMAYQGDNLIDVEFIPCDINTFRIQIGEYDPSKILIIDPLIYSTYLGGFGGEYPEDIIIDSIGNIYIVGWTSSSNFPMLNPFDDTYGGNDDCFITKFDENGSLVYSTFIGGVGDDRGESIAMGSDGSLYVTGSTESDDFPTINALNSTYSGERDVFVLKMNPNGDNLLYSTYIGSSGDENPRTLVLDEQENMYVGGTAYSSGFPMINAYDDSFNGTGDAFVFKLNAIGDELEYSTYIGGSDSDSCRSIALDSEGNLVILGQTRSIDFLTINAYDDTYQGEGTDCFILKLNKTGSGLIFSTYLGGSRYEYPSGFGLDGSDNIYVAGRTSSADFPVVSAFQSTYNDYGDCFVFKMNSSGTELEYSTYVGGWLDDDVFDLVVNEGGEVFVGARTRGGDFPIINGFDRTHNGLYDFVLFQLDSTGRNLLYSTFIGGSDYEWSLEMTADDAGNVYLVGSTDSIDFPTIDAYDSSPNGGGDCVVMKIAPLPSDGDAARLNDLLVFSGFSGVVFLVLLSLFVCRRRIKSTFSTRVTSDPSKKTRFAGYLFGVLSLLLPYGFSYHPDYWAPLSWTQRQYNLAFGLFFIKLNQNGIGFEPINYYLGVFLLAYIPLIVYLLRTASKIAKKTADFNSIVYALIVFTVISFIAFFPVLGPESGSIPIPLHILVCLPLARWGISREPMDPFEGLETIGRKEEAENDQIIKSTE